MSLYKSSADSMGERSLCLCPSPFRGKKSNKNQYRLSSLLLLFSVIIIYNLTPLMRFRFESRSQVQDKGLAATCHVGSILNNTGCLINEVSYLDYIKSSWDWFIVLDQSPMLQVRALVLGRMAKMWYIKKKIRKIGKKLRKSTIALPMFTAIPIYEHSYYPQPYVTHVPHNAAQGSASSYAPVAQVTGSGSAPQASQQMATSASNDHHQTVAFRPPIGYHHHAHHPPAVIQATQATNTPHWPTIYPPMAPVAPSPPLFVDDTGGLYGYYGYTTGASVLGLAFDGGVIIAADTLVSYGSMARYFNCERIKIVNSHTVVAATGDYADYQYLSKIIHQKQIEERQWNDGLQLYPAALHSWITRVAYNKRSRFEPLLNAWVVGGLQPNEDTGKTEPFLGFVDKLGTSYKSNLISTGFGAHLATPLFRELTENIDRLPTEEEARRLVSKAMEVLFYRDARSLPRYYQVVIKADGAHKEGPIEFKGNWQTALMKSAVESI